MVIAYIFHSFDRVTRHYMISWAFRLFKATINVRRNPEKVDVLDDPCAPFTPVFTGVPLHRGSLSMDRKPGAARVIARASSWGIIFLLETIFWPYKAVPMKRTLNVEAQVLSRALSFNSGRLIFKYANFYIPLSARIATAEKTGAIFSNKIETLMILYLNLMFSLVNKLLSWFS